MSWQSRVICGVLDRAGSVALQVVFSTTTIHPGFEQTKTGAMELSAFIVQIFAPNKSNYERCRETIHLICRHFMVLLLKRNFELKCFSSDFLNWKFTH